MMSAGVSRKLIVGILTIAVLLMGLGVTTFALASVTRQIGGGIFSTGTIKGNLNNGEPILSRGDGKELENLEPGQWIERDFFVENIGTQDAYYKLFFEEIEGDLKNFIEVRISRKDTGTVIYEGILGQMTKDNMASTDDYLVPLERRNLTIQLKMSDSTTSEFCSRVLTFKVGADFTQVKNNDDREF